ncbi:MAG: hypothetical protein E6K80_01940 [Candidatus Eisenbacteria bacterium]|uniref:Dockerin domain-containing protein n=1 Tax=Eiseniibacteriota bacterium TaxID=2212470 RepID=A0A538UA65_UNCEI|nr:MAG: hypothetical protein E6K80_01940 [Candidatus Eisenbacteria bacterium]
MIRTATSTILLLCVWATAQAGVPSASQCSEPAGIRLVGDNGATPDPLGSATFVIRHIDRAPVPGAEVIIDFSACSDVTVSPTALQPGVTFDCANHTVTAIADAFGVVTFDLVGVGNGGSPRSLPNCAAVYASRNGVNGIDASLFAADLFASTYRARSDLNGDGKVDGLDASIFAAALFGGGSTASGATGCSP